MIRSILIGLVAGMRSMTPLAAVSEAARRGALPADNGAPFLLSHPLVAAGTKAVAAGELWGDKLKSAPDRIVPLGMLARVITGAVAGAALAPRRQAVLGGLLGATTAVGASYLTFGARMAAIRRFGQTSTGLVEDAITLGATGLIMESAARGRRRAARPR